jgi:hypothetical protein
MTPERRERILQIAHELEDQGLEATNSAVYSRALGHRGDVVQVMKARRAERGNGGSVAVLDAEDDAIPESSAGELQEDLGQLEASYDAWHLALERLWEIEQEGPLSEANFSRKQWLEYQMVQNLQAQERLRPQLEAARLKEAVVAAQIRGRPLRAVYTRNILRHPTHRDPRISRRAAGGEPEVTPRGIDEGAGESAVVRLWSIVPLSVPRIKSGCAICTNRLLRIVSLVAEPL